MGNSVYQSRKWLRHIRPGWVDSYATYFITICARTRKGLPLLEPKERPHAILQAFQHYHAEKTWFVSLALVMPDHVHALIQVGLEHELSHSISSFKRFLSRKHGIEWQEGWFDHRLRRNEEISKKGIYVLNNPIRAGLVKRVDEWPHFWSGGREASPQDS